MCKQENEPEVKRGIQKERKKLKKLKLKLASHKTDMVSMYPSHSLSVSPRETLLPSLRYGFFFLYVFLELMFFNADEPLFSSHFLF